MIPSTWAHVALTGAITYENIKSVHIHDDLKLGFDDFICNIMYSLMS